MCDDYPIIYEMSNSLEPTQSTNILEIQLQFLIKWNPDDLSTGYPHITLDYYYVVSLLMMI